MRKQLYLLILLFSVEASASMLEIRGFKAGGCYSHAGKFLKKSGFCQLELFPEDKTHLSFRLDHCPEKMPTDSWVHARFQLVLKGKQEIAHLIAWAPIATKLAQMTEGLRQGRALPARCQ